MAWSLTIKTLVFFAVILNCTGLYSAPKMVVTDFSVSPHIVYKRDEQRNRVDYCEPHKSIKQLSGWWMSSKENLYNENIGIHARDIMTDKLAMKFSMISRSALESALTDKRSAISKELDVTGPDLTRAVAKLSAVKLGRELGADLAVTGHFMTVDTRSNRFWGGVSSPVNCEVRAYNVSSGTCWFRNTYKSGGLGKSQYATFDKLADKIAGDICQTWETSRGR